MRRFAIPLFTLVALGVGAGTAKAQLVVATPYTGYYSSGYVSVSPSTVYVSPSMGYYNYYPYGYSTYYPYGSYRTYYYPSYYSSYYYPSRYYYSGYYPRFRWSRWRW